MKNLISPLLSVTLSVCLFVTATQSGLAATVAIIDTGFDPSLMGDNIIGGTNTYDNTNDFSDDNPRYHGSSAGIVASGAAPGIELIGIKAFGSEFENSIASIDAAFNYAASQNVRAVVHSAASRTNASLSAMQVAANSGAIVVVQAGNQSGSNPVPDAQKAAQLGGRGIIAGGAKDGEGWLASNRAGDFRDHYLMAEVTGSSNTDWTGTSMAAPRIAAIAASVSEQSPFLTPEQVVEILFQSATDIGTPGVDATYGHGLVDYAAAISAVGESNIPTDGGGGGGGGGGSSGLAIAALAIGGAVAYAVLNKEDELKKTIFVDSFGRAFNFDLSSRASTRSNTPMIGMLNGWQNPVTAVPVGQTSNAQTVAFIHNSSALSPSNLLGREQSDQQIISFRHSEQFSNINYVMGLNSDLAGEFGALSLTNHNNATRHSGRFLYNQVFTTPILGYSAKGSSFKFGWNGGASDHRLGLSVIDEQETNGLRSNSILYENNVSKNDINVGFQLGALVEDGNLFGGSSNGAFSADQTSTYYLGVQGAWALSPNISLIGGYFHGMSKIEASKNSVLDEFSDIHTEGYGVGLLIENAFTPRGSVGFSYSSPLQTVSGSARLTLPTSQNMQTGDIGFDSTNLSFEDGDQENIFEAYYGYELSRRSDLFIHSSYTKSPVSDNELNRSRSLYIGYKRNF